MNESFDLDTALAHLRDRGLNSLLICPHDDPDPDALAAAWAIEKLLTTELSIKTTIAFEGIIGRAENRSMVKELDIKVRRRGGLDLTTFDGVFFVDTQPGSTNHSIPDSLTVLGVVDHHPAHPAPANCPFWDVRPSAGTTATITLEYLRQRSIELDANTATALLYAIKTDTRDLSRGATSQDLDAFWYTFKRANLEKLGVILNPRLTNQYFLDLHRALGVAQIHNNAIVVFLSEISYPDMVAEMADLFVRHRGAEWCLCGGLFGKTLRFSLRTEDTKANAGSVAQTMIAKYGGVGGGHDMLAGGAVNFEESAEPEDVDATWSDIANTFLSLIDAPPVGVLLCDD